MAYPNAWEAPCQYASHNPLRDTMRMENDLSLIPKRCVHVLYTGLSQMQRRLYAKLLTECKPTLREDSSRTLMKAFFQVMKCCSHPYLVDGAEVDHWGGSQQHLVDNSGKLQVLDKLLVKLKAEGSQVVLASGMTRVLTILEDYLQWKRYKYVRMDGATRSDERERLINEFSAKGSDCFICLVTLRCQPMLTLNTAAAAVVLFDFEMNTQPPRPPWTSGSRYHRIGQTHELQIYMLVNQDTFEEAWLMRSELKAREAALEAKSDMFEDRTLCHMRRTLQLDADWIGRSTTATTVDEDIDSTLARSRARFARQLAQLMQMWYFRRATIQQQPKHRRVFVVTVMLVAARLRRDFVWLPPEMWLMILSFVRVIELGPHRN